MTDASAGLAELVAVAAHQFCAELCEDADGVPQPELKALHAALGAWEGVEPPVGLHDDSTPRSATLAALGWLADDPQATDQQRQIARQAYAMLSQQ
jgi:hypothetical protein